MAKELNTEKLLAENAELKAKIQALELQLADQLNSSNHSKALSDSINYAVRIQSAIMQPEHIIKSFLPENFILYRPKDVVSGDFYFVGGNDDKVVFASVDCTGHGVPGALLSVIGFNFIYQAVYEKEIYQPSEILQFLDVGVNRMLRQTAFESGVKDGMDLSLCTLDKNTLELEYSGAYNPLYYISDGELHQIKADRIPIGVNEDGTSDSYTNHKLQLKKGDVVYLFTDGYADQFGGENESKFKYRQLREKLMEVHHLPMEEQKQQMNQTFDDWKGDVFQVDDVLLMGVRL